MAPLLNDPRRTGSYWVVAGRLGSSTLASTAVLQQGNVLQRDACLGGERDAQPSSGREQARGHGGLDDTHVEAGGFPGA